MEQRDLAIPARVLAQGLHADQVDHSGRSRPRQLAELAHSVGAAQGPRHPAVAVAWLSVSLSEGGLTQAELERAFGQQIAEAVGALTPREAEGEAQLRERALGNELAAVVWHARAAAARELVQAC